MTKPMLLAEFARLPPVTRAIVFDGLSGAIDLVAQAAPATHRFLRYQWFAAALAAYGGPARTILIEHDGDPVIALPMVRFGPPALRLAALPGGDRPFRGFPAGLTAGGDAFGALVDELGGEVNALRVEDARIGDASIEALLLAAQARGWAVFGRSGATAAPIDAGAADVFWRIAAQDPILAEMAPGLSACEGGARNDWLLVRRGVPAMVGRALRRRWERGRALLPADHATPAVDW